MTFRLDLFRILNVFTRITDGPWDNFSGHCEKAITSSPINSSKCVSFKFRNKSRFLIALGECCIKIVPSRVTATSTSCGGLAGSH